MSSETSQHRDLLAPFCVGNGVDLGSGGDSITSRSLSIDFPTAYGWPDGIAQWSLDARDLPFRDGVLDYVYSSHLLEDFDDTAAMLTEWARVLRPGGRVVLLLPDEQRYRKYCEEHGHGRNDNHRHDGFSLDYVKEQCLDELTLLHEYPEVGEYSFAVVFERA